MRPSYHQDQECSFSGPLCEIAKGLDDHLCVGTGSSFFAILLCIAIVLSCWAAAVAYACGGAEEVVYRRHAEVRALALNAGER